MISYLQTLINAPTIEDLWECHVERLNSYGFDRVFYGFTRVWKTSLFGDPEDIMVLSNHSEEYTSHYIQNGYYACAPLAQWALVNTGSISWSQTTKIGRTVGFSRREAEVIEFNKKHGVYAGYTICFNGHQTREKAAMFLTARSGMSQDDVDAIWDEHGNEIYTLCNIFHLKAMAMPHTYSRTPLTKRQKQVLEWVGDGKTAQDIATIMGLTAATIEKHLRLARESLGVETTTQAVLKASFQKQIFIMDA
ncbi:LuxR family transcriptional regulator [Falsihalocynthiibacter sp. SS001]|uniref:LuxR family transcriptional regulator n=1 Tax=Falsihalocynthiibacter sp. SS001 TaxID=3349698 RepID=UPI0036D27F1E